MSDVLEQDELLKKFGFQKPGPLRKCLDEQHIPYYLGKGGKIVTTIQALNETLIGTSEKPNNEAFEFDTD